jgi:beta-glucanase (GH16 family)
MANDLTDDALLSLTLPASKAYTKALVGTANATVYAPDGNSALRSGGNDVLIGSSGDNTFFVYSVGDKVIEAAGGGTDTIVSTATYVLPDNVENLRLNGSGPSGPGSITGVGNALGNIISGDAGNQTLDGGFGNDVLTGGAGNDLFVIHAGQGSDLVTDFGNGADRIRLAGFGLTDFSQVLAAATQVGNDIVIQLPGNEALGLKNVNLAGLNAAQFQLDMNRSGLVQTFGDDFNSFSRYDAVTNPTGTWRTVYNDGPGPGGRSIITQGEKQIYVDESIGLNPFTVDNGVLSIHARSTSPDMLTQLYGYQYTSGLLTSKFSHSQLYGVFEITAKLPDQRGAWPAFWLLPTDNTQIAELDVFEAFATDPTTVTNTIHTMGSGVKTGSSATDYVGNTQTGFHTYSIDWEPDFITWYVDGTETFKAATPADMHRPMYMIANVAVGGGGILPNGPLDTTMQIDSINAYQRGTAVTGTGTNDVFTVDSPSQIVLEQPGGGNNTLYSSVDYLLPDNVQTLVLTGTADLRGYANGQDSTIYGNAGNDYLGGSFGNDFIVGGNGNNTMAGGPGNDVFVVGSGSNLVKGGDGYDTLVISGRSGDYIDGVVRGIGPLTNRATGAVDTIGSVENIRFDNGVLSFEGYGISGSAQQIYRLFYTALGRVPTASELAGLLAPIPAQPHNWTEPFAGGLDLGGVAAAIMGGSEYKADTAGMGAVDQVAWFYKAALLNPADAGGLAFWQDQAAHGVALATILTGISESATLIAQTSVTTNGLFIPDHAEGHMPIAPDRQFSIAGGTFSLAASTLLGGATDPDGEQLSLNAVGRAQHGTLSFANGTISFTPNAYFSGDASFTYTISNQDLVSSTGTVTLHVAGSAPAYISDSNSAADKIYDFSGYSDRHLLVASSGHDTIIAGPGGGSYRLGSGVYTVIGGSGADQITFGSGLATVTGGGGADTFTFTKGAIADPAANGGAYDTITDFSGAGNGSKSGDDVLRLVGFSQAAKLSYQGDLAGDPTAHLYAVDDGTYHASFVVHYASGPTQLIKGDYGFFTA